MNKTNVLIIGGGGREHALAWKLAQSKNIGQLYAAPGNPGMASVSELVQVDTGTNDDVVAFALDNNIGLVVVGPEAPLVNGLIDSLEHNGIKGFGPTKAAAQIESSKAFSKDLMKELGVPTASYQNFTDYVAAKQYLAEQAMPIVIKASGLAAGKGVMICHDMDTAQSALKEIMVNKEFGEAGAEVVIEEFMNGPEISIHVVSDGTHYVTFPPAQDHKPAYDGNKGPNTGGMGTTAPLAGVSDELMTTIDTKIVRPIIEGMAKRGAPYKGLLYPGIMLTSDGPKVLEFNARFGDPETQSYMRILDSDLLEIMLASTNGMLNNIDVKWSDQTAANIVLAAGGYPGKHNKGDIISGLENIEDKSIVAFHAGTALKDGDIVTNGGRILGVTATSIDTDEALSKAYAATKQITFKGKQLRTDIGKAHDNSRLKEF